MVDYGNIPQKGRKNETTKNIIYLYSSWQHIEGLKKLEVLVMAKYENCLFRDLKEEQKGPKIYQVIKIVMFETNKNN